MTPKSAFTGCTFDYSDGITHPLIDYRSGEGLDDQPKSLLPKDAPEDGILLKGTPAAALSEGEDDATTYTTSLRADDLIHVLVAWRDPNIFIKAESGGKKVVEDILAEAMSYAVSKLPEAVNPYISKNHRRVTFKGESFWAYGLPKPLLMRTDHLDFLGQSIIRNVPRLVAEDVVKHLEKQAAVSFAEVDKVRSISLPSVDV